MKLKTWDIFRAWPECQSDIRDQYHRSPHILATHQVSQAVVSRKIFDMGFKPEYPGGKNWACAISHDIDWLNYPGISGRNLWVRQGKRLLKGHIKTFIKGWFETQNRRAPEFELERLIKSHVERGIRSTYFFLALEEGEEDFNYVLSQVTDQLESVHEAGNEIALHGGHEAFDSLEVINREKGRLLECVPTCVGYRNHYLRFDVSQTWKLLERSGFEYDATFGYAGYPGFRNGMCYPFQPFDNQENRFLNLLEVPLVVMDVSLFQYLGLTEEMAMRYVKQLVEEVKAVQGVFTLLWHNNYLDGKWGAFYLKVLDFLGEWDPCFLTHQELTNWWKQQGYPAQLKDYLMEIRKSSEIMEFE